MGPEWSRQPSETTAPANEFTETVSAEGAGSPLPSSTRRAIEVCQCEEAHYEARPEDFDVTKGLLQSLDSQNLSLNSQAQEAVRDEHAFALETPATLIEHIRTVQESDRAYHGNVALTQGRTGEAMKTANIWGVDPSGVLRRNGKVWIPEDAVLRANILMKNHDDPIGGHYGVDKTIALLKVKYWWPHVRRDVSEYIKRCAACQLNKIRRHKPWGLLVPLPAPETAWRHYSLDFVTDLPQSKDDRGNMYDAILVLVDRFSKYVRYLPVTKAITAQGVAELLLNQCFLKMGPPDTLVSDRGSVFTSQFWSDICYHLKINHKLSTAFHPQTDGQTERQNQELETYLRIYMNYRQDDWVKLLPYAEYAYNSKEHSAHGHTPIRVAFGTNPKGFDGVPDEHWLRKPPAPWIEGGTTPELRRQVSTRLAEWADLATAARNSLEKAQRTNAKWYNTTRLPLHFAEGDSVLLRAKNITTSRPSKKLDARYLGPFLVTKKIGKLAYRLDLPPSMARLHPVFNISLLEPWSEPFKFHNFKPGPTQIMEETNSADRYEVEGILDHKDTKARGREYKVKWLGWPWEAATWEPAENLDNCEEILQEYFTNTTENSGPDAGQTPESARSAKTPESRGRPRGPSRRRGGKGKL